MNASRAVTWFVLVPLLFWYLLLTQPSYIQWASAAVFVVIAYILTAYTGKDNMTIKDLEVAIQSEFDGCRYFIDFESGTYCTTIEYESPDDECNMLVVTSAPFVTIEESMEAACNKLRAELKN